MIRGPFFSSLSLRARHEHGNPLTTMVDCHVAPLSSAPRNDNYRPMTTTVR